MVGAAEVSKEKTYRSAYKVLLIMVQIYRKK